MLLSKTGRAYMALVYLGLVAFGCLLFILTPRRHAKPQYWARLQSNDTSDGTTTVIIGAGVIGLCTANHLAKTVNRSGTQHKVIIVEAAETVFNASSSTNTGILSNVE
ncbi:MAG: hypothetical protein Q9207_004268 [Kuettlingeria erythrocarpa]